MARESERLGRVLLNTISHELRTPLTTIKGSVTALMDSATGEDREARSALLLAETLTATDRLNSIVENLLSMSRLESGMLRLKKSDNDIFDLVSVVADALRRQSRDHPLSIRIDEDVPLVSLDFILMVQVLTNILLNADRHTPPGTPVELSVERKGHGVRITVADEGPRGDSRGAPPPLRQVLSGKERGNGGRRPGAFHLQGNRRGAWRQDHGLHQPQGRALRFDLPSRQHREGSEGEAAS